MKLSDFRVVGWKFTKFIKSYLKPQLSFSLKFASLFKVPWQITLAYFFNWNFIWFGQKEPIKVQNFRLLTAHVIFNQICTLIGSFCWKYNKFQLKKYRGVTSRYTEEWCKIWGKTDLFQKWQEFGQFWSEHSSLENLHFDRSLSWKIYNVWPKKVQRSYLSWHWRVMQKLKKKLTCGLEKWHEEFGKFSSEHLKVSKLVFSWDPFVQSRKCMSYKLTEEL